MKLFDDMGAVWGPRYREAIQAETDSRDEAFAADADFIAGVEVLPMTIEHFALLVAIKSPFVCGGTLPTASDVAMFLWLVSPRYAWALGWRNWIEPFSRKLSGAWFWWVRRRFVVRLRNLNAAKAVSGINAYLRATFMDSPGEHKAGAEAPAYWSVFASLVDSFASEYHWPEDQIRKVRLRCAFQYLRCMAKRRDPRAVLFNPSDSVRGDFMREVNAA